MFRTRNRFQAFLTALILLSAVAARGRQVDAGQLQLSWTDNSTNEDGFGIERKAGTTGTYNQITTVPANDTAYTDVGLTDGATYCYRVFAFNADGISPYSPEACGTAKTPVLTFTLSVVKAGTGSGTVTSSPVGISCGSTCSATFNSGTAVALSATAATGYTFAGWTGAGCDTGTVTMDAGKTCTATFNLQPSQVASTVITAPPQGTTFTAGQTVTATGSGTNLSWDIDLIGDGLPSFKTGVGTSITFTVPSTATPTQYVRITLSGAGGSATRDYNIVTAGTVPSPQTFTLSVVKAGAGAGTVTSSPAGISCGTSCSGNYNSGTVVTLFATAATGSTFAGWSGNGCSTGIVTVDAAKTCTATFAAASQVATQAVTRIGVFRPDTGEWFLDHTGNGQWDGCGVDICITTSGAPGILPVVGSWSGNGTSNIGIFNAATGTWQLDTNGDGILDCSVDTCIDGFGQPGDLPVTREMSALNGTIIGTFTPRTVVQVKRRKKSRKVVRRGIWNLDLDGNNTFDGCSVDECDNFGNDKELPVVGDWSGTGTEEIGLFLQSKRKWYLDLNGNGKWDGCRKDRCLRFGRKGDLPVVGDWDGTGNVRIGVYRPSTGMWYLDMNGNGKLDKCTVDACLGPYGQPGDLPVTGKW